MEENSNMTAERSLEIITEQIEKSRRAVSKTTGRSLYISGICIMCTAVLVVLINIITMSQGMVGIGHLLWFALPVVIWLLSRKYIKDREHAPVSLVSSMVAKTWITFGFFGIGFFIIALIWGWIGARLLPISEYATSQIRVAPVIVLLMGMAITMTGHLVSVESPFTLTAAVISSSLPCLTIFIFALVGLLLPGMMLKKQSV